MFGPLERHLRNLGFVPPEFQDHQRFSVEEDPDELGYWAIPLPDAIEVPSSLAICNAALSAEQQAEIQTAALLAHRGHDLDAERCRRFADYDNVGFRDDADRPL